jgi:hypothetical protein
MRRDVAVQSTLLRQTAVRKALKLPVQGAAHAGSGSGWAAPAGTGLADKSVNQLFLQASYLPPPVVKVLLVGHNCREILQTTGSM